MNETLQALIEARIARHDAHRRTERQAIAQHNDRVRRAVEQDKLLSVRAIIDPHQPPDHPPCAAPACEQSRLLAHLATTEHFTPEHIQTLKALGYVLRVVTTSGETHN